MTDPHTVATPSRDEAAVQARSAVLRKELGLTDLVLSEGFRSFGSAPASAALAVIALLSIRAAQASVMFAGNTRLPMVAGWDGLLPEWFTMFHSRYTGRRSIRFCSSAQRRSR
jgi:amino acid transporter